MQGIIVNNSYYQEDAFFCYSEPPIEPIHVFCMYFTVKVKQYGRKTRTPEGIWQVLQQALGMTAIQHTYIHKFCSLPMRWLPLESLVGGTVIAGIYIQTTSPWTTVCRKKTEQLWVGVAEHGFEHGRVAVLECCC